MHAKKEKEDTCKQRNTKQWVEKEKSAELFGKNETNVEQQRNGSAGDGKKRTSRWADQFKQRHPLNTWKTIAGRRKSVFEKFLLSWSNIIFTCWKSNNHL